MKKQRILATVLLLFVSICTLAGCGGGKEPAATTSSEVGTTSSSSAPTESATTTTEATTAATTTLPTDLTFDGYEFIIVGERGFALNTFFVTRATNALENRLLRAYEGLEDELDIVITFMDTIYDTALANALAGKATGDFIHYRHQYWIPLAVKGYIQPLNTDAIKAAGLDVSDPEQVDIYQTNVSKRLDGENVWAFTVSGEYFFSPWGHGLAFNKELCKNAGYPAEDIYQMVRDHAWTWDKFEEICRAVSDPDKGNYGYATLTNDTVEIASNVAINSIGADGRWTSNIDSEEFIRAAKWLVRIVWDREVCAEFPIELSGGYPPNDFYRGNQGFKILWSGDFGFEDGKCTTAMGDDYGYVPFPMGPDATEYSHVIGDHYGFCLETANKNAETSAYIMGKFASLLNDPDQYAVHARGFMRDEESVEMIMDYMLPNATFNTARLSADTRQVIREMVPQLLRTTTDTAIEGMLETYAVRMRQQIEKLYQ